MTALDLDAIEADIKRHASAIGPAGDKAWYAAQLAREVPALAAEVRRLRAALAGIAGMCMCLADEHCPSNVARKALEAAR